MIKTPKCIIVTGRPGSGKSTLSIELGNLLHLPVICRDTLKEGYVSTFEVRHDRLPDDTNKKVTDFFFSTVLSYMEAKVSVVIEAAFQHGLWSSIIPILREKSQVIIIICEIDPEICAKRHLERGLSDPSREHFHGDKRVSVFKEFGKFLPPGKYIPPNFELPTLEVSTLDGYSPSLSAIENFVKSQ